MPGLGQEMATIDGGPAASLTRLCVVVESTGSMAGTWPGLRQRYMDPLLKAADGGLLGSIEFAVIIYQTRSPLSTAEVASTGWTRSTADVREWLDIGAAMAGGGAAETTLTEGLAEATGMFALPSHAGPGGPVGRQLMLFARSAQHKLLIEEGSPVGHHDVISRLAQMDVRIHVASPRGVQWPSTIYKTYYGGPSAEDMAAATVSRTEADCVLVSPSGWPAAHAHLRMLQENSRRDTQAVAGPGHIPAHHNEEPAVAVPAAGYSPMTVGHAQGQAASAQQGPSAAQEPGSAGGVDNHQNLMSIMQQQQQQQVPPLAQQQAVPAAQQQQEWLTPTTSHLQQGQQQAPQQQPPQQVQRTSQQRQLLVWQGPLVAGAALAGSELVIGSIACSIVGSNPPADVAQFWPSTLVAARVLDHLTVARLAKEAQQARVGPHRLLVSFTDAGSIGGRSFLADLQRAKQGLCVEVPMATVVFVMASPSNAGTALGSGGPRLIGLVLPAVG